jgi:hypothetical protein
MQRMNVKIVCSACLTEACAQGVLLCEDARKASFILTHALHEDGCPLCRTGTEILRSVLEALCRRDGLSLESDADPGHPARNFELADRLGIPDAFKVYPWTSVSPVSVSPPSGPQRTGDPHHPTTNDQRHTGTPRHPSTDPAS